MEVTTVFPSRGSAVFAQKVISAHQILQNFYHILVQLDTTVLMEPDLPFNFLVLVVLTAMIHKEQVWHPAFSVHLECIVKEVVYLNRLVIAVLGGTV
jgi:hypothetical protein